MPEQKSDLVSRGACWKHADRNEKPYLSGQIKEDDGTVREILIFVNNKKDNPKAPDFRIMEKVKPLEDSIPPNEADEFLSGGGVGEDIPF
jgi:uncharacterized protein (DUF736 family)